MASPIVLNALTQGGTHLPDAFGPAQERGARMNALNQNMGIEREQQGQRNQLFQQSQDDRQRSMQQQEQETQLRAVREDLASYLIARKQGPEAAQQVWSQLAPKYGQDPASNPDEIIPSFIQSNPGILGEATGPVLKDFFAPQQEMTNDQRNAQLYATDQNFRKYVDRPTGAQQAPDRELVSVIGPNGQPVLVPRSQASGKQPTPTRTGAGGPMPPTSIKALRESREALRAAQSMENTFKETRALMQGGPTAEGVAKPALEIGPIDRAQGYLANKMDLGTQNSRGLLELTRVRNKLRNDYLMLAKGVQTEGDAQRAMDSMMPDTNDPAAILEQLDKVQAASEQLQAMHEESVRGIESEYGRDPSNLAPLQPGTQPTAPPGGGFRVLGRVK